MIKNIGNFVNNNITTITIIICMIAIWMIYDIKVNKSEYMDGEITSDYFNTNVVKLGKKVNFRCSIDGVNYYLAQIPVAGCNKRVANDCINTAIVLIPENQINAQLEQYKKNVKTNIDICNSSRTIRCNNIIASSGSKEKKCNTEWKQCDIDRFYIHDFMIEDVTKKKDKIKKYLFRGTSMPNIDGTIMPTMLNQQFVYTKGSNVLCGDTYLYDSGKSNNEFGEVMVSERVLDESENMLPIKLKLMFKTQAIIVGIDPKTKKETQTKLNKKNYTYIGLCKNTETNKFSCKYGNVDYKRVCLVPKNETTLKNNMILEFEPIIVE